MTVPLEEDEVRTLIEILDACADAVPGISAKAGLLVGRLTARIDRARAEEKEEPTGIAGFVADVRAAFRRGRLIDVSTTADVPVRRWDYVAPAARRVKEIVESEPRFLSRVDGLGVYLRETLDALGLPVTDPDSVYALVALSGVFVELTSNGHNIDAEQVSAETVIEVAALAQTITGALLPFMPDGVL